MDPTAFETPDGSRLPLCAWLPSEAPPEAVILALHGFCDHAGAWETFGPAAAARHVAVVTYDQRGFGQRPDRGRWPGADALIADVRAALKSVHLRYPETPLFLMGESMGAALAICAVTGPDATDAPVSGVILSAPALWARATMSWPMSAAMWIARRLFPNLRLTGRGVERYATNNMPLLEKLSCDPLWIHAPTIESLAGLTDVMDIAYERFDQVRAPVLLLYGLNDEIVPAGPVRDRAERLDLSDGKNRIGVYPEGWHMLTRDVGGSEVIADILSWIRSPQVPLPSGADWNAAPFLDGTLRSTMERHAREHPRKAWERLSEAETSRTNDTDQTRRDDTGQTRTNDTDQTRRDDTGQTRRDDTGQTRRDDTGQTRRDDTGQTRRDDTGQTRRDADRRSAPPPAAD